MFNKEIIKSILNNIKYNICSSIRFGKFNSLEDKCLYYRSLTDYRLKKKSYVIVMCDGKNFSKLIKKKYNLPFDERFINMMNEVAKYVCKEVQGCKFAYTQSDEISFIITDLDSDESDPYFNYRLCKMQSIIASLCTAKFNQLVFSELCDTPCSSADLKEMIEKEGKLPVFDCKAWTVPSYNDTFAWLLYRQLDCIRNSKQQAAQTYLSHNELKNLKTDVQIELLKAKYNIDWHNDFNDGEKFGRFIYKEEVVMENENGTFARNKWIAHNAFMLSTKEGKEHFENLKIFINKP